MEYVAVFLGVGSLAVAYLAYKEGEDAKLEAKRNADELLALEDRVLVLENDDLIAAKPKRKR